MKQYARLTEVGTLQLLQSVPCIMCPTEQQFQVYADEHGYKPYTSAPQPGMYYVDSYDDTGADILQVWTPVDLDTAKKDALQLVQRKRDTAMNGVVIPCQGLPNGIWYDTEAMTMAQGLVILEGQGLLSDDIEWTDAADESHVLTTELLAAIVQAMLTHVNTTQAQFKPTRDAIRAASDVDELEQIIKNIQ